MADSPDASHEPQPDRSSVPSAEIEKPAEPTGVDASLSIEDSLDTGSEESIRHSEDPQAALDDRNKQLAQALSELSDQNLRLVQITREARDQINTLKNEVERLAEPPGAYGVFLRRHDLNTMDIVTSGRELRVSIAPNLQQNKFGLGQRVILNEALSVVAVPEFDLKGGELVTLKSLLGNGDRAVVVGPGEDERVVMIADTLLGEALQPGDSLLLEPRVGYVSERIPKPKSELEYLFLAEPPDVTYPDIGGLGPQIEQIRNAVEMPYLHRELFREHNLEPPKGVLLYGPPGCGKTLVAKAVANSLAAQVEHLNGTTDNGSLFLNIKGPELLNKYVGETERSIRLLFKTAREKASDGTPVIVFFDEMDAIFRTRGSGVSSDIETTIVPQLLSEIDGVVALENVIVIGASNREDMIDPAILRAGRLDVKINIGRPNATAAREIFTKFITPDLPLHPDDMSAHRQNAPQTRQNMINRVVDLMYGEGEPNRFVEVTYESGHKEVIYFSHFSSGAVIRNVVNRAKLLAVLRHLSGGPKGLGVQDLLRAAMEEIRAAEDLANRTSPDDWARLAGARGERLTFVRTLRKVDGEYSGRALDIPRGNFG
jgi:proteasome-associated ATPase